MSIEAFGDVCIDNGFIAKEGANVVISAKGSVSITGGEVLSGSTLTIKATNIDVQKDLYISGDSNLILLNN